MMLVRLICLFCPGKDRRHRLREWLKRNMLGIETHYERTHRLYNIGANSYIAGGRIVNPAETSIGKYCSIADGVSLGTSQNPLNRLSTHAFTFHRDDSDFYGSIKVPYNRLIPHNSVKPVNVGHDVWIGRNAIIMDGVTIGTGAVVGAMAVVTKDVPPYAIVVGVPARIIRYRFDENTIKRLLESRWWDYPESFIANELKFDDIEQCLEALAKNRHLLEGCAA